MVAGKQLAILLKIARLTYGSIGRPEWASLTATRLAKLVAGDAKHVERLLLDLSDVGAENENPKGRGLILREKDGRGYKYKLNPRGWAKARKYEPKAIEKPIVAEPEAEDGAQPVVQVVPVGQPLIVKAGRDSKPFTFPTIEKPFLCTNKTTRDLRFQPGMRDGMFVFTATEGAADIGRISPISAAKRGAPAVPDIGRKSPISAPKSEQSQGVLDAKPDTSPLRDLLNQYSVPLLKKPIDDAKFAQVARKLNGTPLAQFEQILYHSKDRIKSAGIFTILAADAAAAHKHAEKIAVPDEPARRGPAVGSESWIREQRRNWQSYPPDMREELRRMDSAAFEDLS